MILGACSGVTAPVGPGGTAAPPTQPNPGLPTPAGPAGPPSAIEVGQQYQHQVPADGAAQLFTFEPPPGSVVSVDATAAAGNRRDMQVTQTPPSGFNMSALVQPGQSGSTRAWILNDESSGRWTLELDGAAGDTVSFIVHAPPQTDGGGKGDAGGHAGRAASIDLGQPLTGLLGDEDREDWYAVPLEGGEVVTVDLAAPAGQTGSHSVAIVHNGNRLGSTQVNPGGMDSVRQVFAQDQTGMAQVHVTGAGAYTFTVEAAPQRDGGTDGDAGADFSAAKRVELGQVEGILGGQDRADYFVLSMPRDAYLHIEATVAPDALDRVRIELLYEGANLVREDLPGGATRSWLAALVNEPEEDVYLRATGDSGAYSVTISAVTQPDGGDGTGDASGERATAKEIQPEGSFDGVLNNRSNLDARDWYTFEATQDGTMVIELSIGAEADRQTRMLVNQGTRRVGDVSVGPGGSGTAEFEVTAGSVYHIELGAGGIAPYSITFR